MCLALAFFICYVISDFLKGEVVNEHDQETMDNFSAPAKAQPWEYHYKEHFIKNNGRTPKNSPSWSGVDEPWFRKPKVDTKIWPKFMASYPNSKTGNLLRDRRLNDKQILMMFEFKYTANLFVYQADMANGKLGTETNPGHWLKKGEGPIWNYWWHIDKSLMKKDAPDRTTNKWVDRFTLHESLTGGLQWTMLYYFSQIREENGLAATMKTQALDARVEVHNGRAKAFVELHGRKVWLTYIYTQTTPAMFNRNHPQWFLFIGDDAKTGKRVIEYRDASKKRERAGWTPTLGKTGERQFYNNDELKEFQRRWKSQEFPGDNLGYCIKQKEPTASKPSKSNVNVPKDSPESPEKADDIDSTARKQCLLSRLMICCR